ncbi:MAG: trigger factor [Candidatus Zixiibacteriota bacterium]
MKVEVKEVEQLVLELSVEIPADVVNGEMEKAFADLRRTATVKGFRKGKAPMSIIKSIYSDEIMSDVADELIRSSYPKAVEEKKLDVASRPQVTAFHYDDDGSFRYTAKVEVLPKIGTIDLTNLQITSANIEVKDKDVDVVAESIRAMYADFRPVEREVQENDLVVVDLKKTYDPQLVLKDDAMRDIEIDLARTFTVKEFKKQLPGMKAGEQKEIEVVYDDDYPDPAFAGAHIKYLCTMKEVRERVLPEFNDAFAQRTGQAKTALELKIKIRENLKRRYVEDQKRIHKNQIIGQMCEQNQFPVPQTIVERYLDAMVEDEKRNDRHLDEEEFRRQFRGIAVNTVRWHMLYHHIAEQERIEVLPSDSEKLISDLATDHKITYEQAKQALERSGNLASIQDTLLEEKVLDFLISRAKVVPG